MQLRSMILNFQINVHSRVFNNLNLPRPKGGEHKKWGVFPRSLSRGYGLGNTQSLIELSIAQNENVCHQDRPSRRESHDLASPSG